MSLASRTPTALRKRRVCLIGCSASKLDRAAFAEELYTGDMFRKSLTWARQQAFDDIAILSARHHLVDLQQYLQPYEQSMRAMGVEARRGWASIAFAAINGRWALRCSESDLVLLAGVHYTQDLCLHIQIAAPATRIVRPLAGMGIGQQKAWLRNAIAGHAQPVPAA